MSSNKDTRGLYGAIISELSPPDGKVVSSAQIHEKIGDEFDDIRDGIADLIRFGALEFVGISGSGMHVRIRLREPIVDQLEEKQTPLDDSDMNTVWLAYIVSGTNCRERRSQRLFESQQDAKKHLMSIGPVDDLTPLAEVDGVWCQKVQSQTEEYAVLREEPVFSQAYKPYE
jgi:hypothetical protein